MSPQFLIYVLSLILAAHWVSDFLLQSSWMAQSKNKSNLALSAHVLTYGAIFLLITGAPVFVLVNMGLHFLVDYVTSRINTRLWAAKEVHYFFVSVGADQLIHFVCLFGTFSWLYLT